MSIQSKADYREYLKADREVNHINTIFDEFKYTWIFIKALRRYEYYSNTKRSRIWKLLPYLKLRRWGLKTGISLRKNCFGKGLYIPHYGSIVVNNSARFGDYCIIQNGVNISSGVKGGDHIYLGAGAKILRNVEIADHCIIGANAVVTKSIPEKNAVAGGIPARIISHNGMQNRTEV